MQEEGQILQGQILQEAPGATSAAPVNMSTAAPPVAPPAAPPGTPPALAAKQSLMPTPSYSATKRLPPLQARDVRLRPKLEQKCSEELAVFCKDVSPGALRCAALRCALPAAPGADPATEVAQPEAIAAVLGVYNRSIMNAKPRALYIRLAA